MAGWRPPEALAQAAAGLGPTVMERLGYAPVSLGSLAGGSPLTSARGSAWSPLNFQDLVKSDVT